MGRQKTTNGQICFSRPGDMKRATCSVTCLQAGHARGARRSSPVCTLRVFRNPGSSLVANALRSSFSLRTE